MLLTLYILSVGWCNYNLLIVPSNSVFVVRFIDQWLAHKFIEIP